MKTFSNTILKSELKKYLNFHLRNFGTVKKFNSYSKNFVIFTVLAENRSLYNINLCRFQSAFINKFGKLEITYTLDNKELKHFLGEIDFFNRFPKDKAKLNFPTIKLK